jgi:glycosyltransferase involved in cell wall biosynthesis
VTLVIFGDGPARPALAAEVEARGLGDRVRLLGRVDETDLARWFRTATAFVSMSRKEAFGLTLVEAAAAGAAVVASDVPAYRELAERLGPERVTLVDVDADPDTLAHAIASALERRPRPVGANMLPTWTGMASDVLEGYGRVLRRPVAAGQVAE